MDTTLAPVTTGVPQLSPAFIKGYSDKMVPWGPVGYIVYKRTYARRVCPVLRTLLSPEQIDQYLENNIPIDTEEWHETLGRGINAILRYAQGAISLEEGEALYDDMFYLRACFSGRSLWQLGTPTVDKLGLASLISCWFVTVDSVDTFAFTFDMLMLGGGVGFNVQKENVYQLPKVQVGVSIVRKDTKDADFIISDKREGWIELLAKVLDSFFYTGKGFSYSTICVRGKGTPIRSFGGVASGPEDLCKGIADIEKVFRSRAGKQLRPTDVMDIKNIIGSIVVSGNVRRSAELCLGDPDDYQFLRAKDWSDGAIPNWRAMSNNTVVANSFEHLTESFWKGYEVDEYGRAKGEPYGLFNRELSRTKGRISDRATKKDLRVEGTNPCGEISLEPWECCNLTEIYLPNIESKEQFRDIAARLFKINKVITTLPCHWPQAQEVVSRNRRLGVGVTGIWQAPELVTEEALDMAYTGIRDTDVEFSKELSVALGYSIKPSIKLTTVKPSGTLSLLAGVSPGAHPEFAPFYIRRMRFASSDALVERCREAGYHVEFARKFDGMEDRGTVVISFPIKARQPKDGSELKSAADYSAIEMLEMVKHLQAYWSDNAVSCTVYYRKEELPEIKEWLAENYENHVKSISFLLYKDHGFVQAPMEAIESDVYDQMCSNLKPIETGIDIGGDLAESVECLSGQCPVK
jgi:ribonucleoside-triphosphate reductase